MGLVPSILTIMLCRKKKIMLCHATCLTSDPSGLGDDPAVTGLSCNVCWATGCVFCQSMTNNNELWKILN